MANLTFIYGTMESGKTTKLLQDNYNYQRHGHNVVIIKPIIDLKGDDKIVSRNLGSANVDIILGENDSILSLDNLKKIKICKAVLVDEAQFLSQNQIIELWQIAHVLNIGVICYGLKSDFRGMPFEGTTALIGYADIKTELTVYCQCGMPAVFNARKINGKYVCKGNSVAIDGFSNVTYEAMCSKCYLKRVFNKKMQKELKDKIKYLKQNN